MSETARSQLGLLLGPDSPLRSVLPQFEPRAEQLKMAEAVERALRRQDVLLVEAGTGTGKTLAYLLPALLSEKKVVISTATKTLQEQLLSKDLPLLSRGLERDLRAQVLKGRQNYLCLQRYETAPAELLWPQLREWAEGTATGDREELDLPDGLEVWKQLSTTAESCLGPTCPRYQRCFVTRARAQAAEAQVLVVNHHLFFADLAIRTSGGGEGVLPPYQAVIFDEAHALEDIAQSFFGRTVSSWALSDLGQDAATAKASDGEEATAGLLAALGLALQGRAGSFAEAAHSRLRLPESGGVRLDEASLEALRTDSEEVVEALQAIAATAGDSDNPTLQSLARRATRLRGDLEAIALDDAVSKDGTHVFWAERRGRGVSLRAAPIEVAQEMKQRLYAQTESVVFTSGTLTAEGRFDFFERRMGLGGGDPPTRTLRLSSPFDYASQAALYLPSHLPQPTDDRFASAVAEELLTLCELSGGRAFALFTSLRNMDRVHRLVKDRLPYSVLLQGSRPKRALLEAFRAEPSVLFASHSFWEGVDIVGEALSLVVIDKLPFASPGEPQVSARIEMMRARGEDPFAAYQLPEATVALQQGFGRLIRSRQDRGMVAILDPRISTRTYGKAFLDSLPPATRVRSIDALTRWWRQSKHAS